MIFLTIILLNFGYIIILGFLIRKILGPKCFSFKPIIPIIVGFTLGSWHLYQVGHIVKLILSGVEPDWPMYWLIFLFSDFPISLLWLPLSALISMFPSDIAFFGSPYFDDPVNFITPFIFFSIVGTTWWIYLPKMITILANKIIHHFIKK